MAFLEAQEAVAEASEPEAKQLEGAAEKLEAARQAVDDAGREMQAENGSAMEMWGDSLHQKLSDQLVAQVMAC